MSFAAPTPVRTICYQTNNSTNPSPVTFWFLRETCFPLTLRVFFRFCSIINRILLVFFFPASNWIPTLWHGYWTKMPVTVIANFYNRYVLERTKLCAMQFGVSQCGFAEFGCKPCDASHWCETNCIENPCCEASFWKEASVAHPNDCGCCRCELVLQRMACCVWPVKCFVIDHLSER